jgi:bifunctional non-homologous end joining protein LigD
MARAKLDEYRAKRDFGRTPEPRPGAKPPKRGSRFVVHEHHARRLHWDLRLERDGALMSWAIPNGIPQDPAENRLAVHVEDHPLEYLDFKGKIPAGDYGAGEVVIWDRGRYDCEKLEEREVIAVFHGKRMRGRYALFRTGKEERDWMIHRMDPPERPRQPMPEHVQPMLAALGRLPGRDAEFGFEVKWDGVRAILYWRPGRLRIESRNLNDITSRYPELRALGEQLGSREAVLDGEIVAFDDDGKPSFERLQRRIHLSSASAIRRLAGEAPVTYVIFDLLYLDGERLLDHPYSERRAALADLSLEGRAWQTPAHRVGGGAELLAATAELGLEGVIAKRLGSLYRAGARGADWVKVKNVNRQEFVIGGWLAGQGARADSLGALLVGYREQPGGDGALRYAGRVGTGFDQSELAMLARELARHSRKSSPFDKHGPAPPRGARFVKPELVAEVEFSDWTRDGILRHSAYKGLRNDKPASEIVREEEPDARDAGPPLRGASTRALTGDAVAPVRVPYTVLRESTRQAEIEVGGRKLRLSNRDKVFYPSTGFTKGQMIDYYAAVAPALLPHLAGRPLTLKRYPEGVEGDYFYEKRCPGHRPDWVKTTPVPSERGRGTIDYCLVEDLPTLIWLANLADLELHPSLSRAKDIAVPTAIVFDLDPGRPAGLRECCKVALALRELFQALGMRTSVKSSGSKGLQAYVPLNTNVPYERTKPFARAVAQLLEREHPRLVVSRMAKSEREGKVLIDWSQNDPHKTTVCVYSLRARERPAVSTPLHWEEVERGARARGALELSLEPAKLLDRVDREGDLLADLLTTKQRLPELGAVGGEAPARSAPGKPAGAKGAGKAAGKPSPRARKARSAARPRH